MRETVKEKKKATPIFSIEIIDKSIQNNKNITINHEFVCYDFLDLRNKNELIKILENASEDVTEFEIFSNKINMINYDNKKNKRFLFITSKKLNINPINSLL